MENENQPTLDEKPADIEQVIDAEQPVVETEATEAEAPVVEQETATVEEPVNTESTAAEELVSVEPAVEQPVVETSVQQSVTEASVQQPKKKKPIVWIVALLVAVALIGVAVYFIFFFNKTNNPDGISFEKKTPEKEAYSADYKLKVDYEAGQITLDEYVKQLTYAEYDKDKLDEKYRSDKGALIGYDGKANEIYDLISENQEKISKETIEEFLRHYLLADVTLEKDGPVSNTGDAVLADNIFWSESYLHRLDKVILSSGGNFLIWYTTTGEDAITDERAKTLADNLETNIANYSKLTGYNYSFQGVLYNTDNYGYAIAKKRLEEEGIPAEKIQSAMGVYVYDMKSEIAGASYNWHRCDLDNIAKCLITASVVQSMSSSAVAWPYITVNTTAFSDEAGASSIINHELFHHFQTKIICPKSPNPFGTCPEVKEVNYYKEALANYFSAKVTDMDGGDLLPNWAGYYGEDVRNGLINIHSGDSYGYGQFPYFYSYDNLVDGGLGTLVEAHKQENPYAYINSITDAEKMKEVINDSAFRAISKEYDLKQMKNIDMVALENVVGENFDLKKVSIPAGAIHFYAPDPEHNVKWSFEFSSSGSSVSVLMIGRKDGKYHIFKTASSSLSIKNTDCSGYDDIYLVVTNADLTRESEYSIKYKRENIEEETEEDVFSFNHYYDNYAVEYTMDLDFGSVKTTAKGQGVVDEKHQRSYLSSTISVMLGSMELESYSDFYNGVDFYTNPQKSIGGGILDLINGDEEESPTWLKANAAKHTIDISLVARKVRSSKDSENLGNGHFKLKMTSQEMKDLMEVANSGDDSSNVEFKSGTVDADVYVNEYGRITKIVYDFGPLVPKANKFTCEMKVFDYNRAGDVIIPESIRYGAVEK